MIFYGIMATFAGPFPYLKRRVSDQVDKDKKNLDNSQDGCYISSLVNVKNSGL
jgi:hypothetical protein